MKDLLLSLVFLFHVFLTTAAAEASPAVSDIVVARIKNTSDFGAYRLQIKVAEDTITLEGWVAKPESLTLLKQFAKEAAPTRKLVNRIVLSPAEGPESGLAQAVYQAIRKDNDLKGYSLVVEVLENNSVVIRGKVNDTTIIPQIVSRARKVAGVREVRSELIQRLPPTDAEMEREAKDALKQAGFTGAPGVRTRLDVTVEQGVAYLRGQAEIPKQIDIALSAVLRVYGVHDVRNYATLPQYPAPNVHIGIPR